MATPPSILYKYLDADGAIKTLENRTLKFSSPLSLNDPFEFLYGDVPQKYLDELYVRFCEVQDDPNEWAIVCKDGLGIDNPQQISELRDLFSLSGVFKYKIRQIMDLRRKVFDRLHKKFLLLRAVSCFSETALCIPMWGHYADKSKGCVIGFDSSAFENWYQVNYSDKRVSMMAKGNDDDKNIASMTTKSSDWEYEKEWRLIKMVNDEELEVHGGIFTKVFKPSAIKEIIIGLRTEDQLKQIAMRFKMRNHCKVRFLTKHPEKYDLVPKTFEEMVADTMLQ